MNEPEDEPVDQTPGSRKTMKMGLSHLKNATAPLYFKRPFIN